MNYGSLVFEEANKISHLISTILMNDTTAPILVTQGLLKTLDFTILYLYDIQNSEERNNLLHNLIIILSNLFGDYETSD